MTDKVSRRHSWEWSSPPNEVI